MRRLALLLSEVPPMQGAHARRDGVLFQPLSVGIPPWAESEDKLLRNTIPSPQLSQLLNKHLLRDGGTGYFRLADDSGVNRHPARCFVMELIPLRDARRRAAEVQ